MTADLMMAFSGVCAASGCIVEALSIFISWSGLLRANEAIDIILSDVALPGDARIAHSRPTEAAVQIRDAKTSPLQLSVIADHRAILAVRYAVRRRAGMNGTRLLNTT